MGYLFTSESVSEGHPDKVCDRISDTVLDLFLEHEAEARVGCETLATTNRVILAGEVRATEAAMPEILEQIEPRVRAAVADIGYEQDKFHHAHFEFQNYLHEQSADIAQGVDASEDSNEGEGAGDQGLMFGYACDETASLMPLPIWLSHQLVKKQSEVRKSGKLSWLRPDAKSQVTLKYQNNTPMAIDTIVISTQHDPDISQKDIHEAVIEEIIKPTLPGDIDTTATKFLINPTGKFVIGGPQGDCGLTGRKIIVDTYGGAAPHGGGAFSGKDPSKVDRSAAYAARYVAKNIVANGLASRCLVQLSYAIGVAQPTSIMVDTFGTGKVSNEEMVTIIRENFDLRPKGIVQMLDLLRPIYRKTAAYGHFGRTPESNGAFSWEKTDKIDIFSK